MILNGSRISLHKAKTIEASLSTGNYSRLAVDFNLERAYWYYYMTIYVPLSMVVLCSWMAFFLDRKYRYQIYLLNHNINGSGTGNDSQFPNSAARVIYVLMILLVMSASIAQVNNRLPFTSYTKSIDVYTGVHVAFVFCALVGNLTKLTEYFIIIFKASFNPSTQSRVRLSGLHDEASRGRDPEVEEPPRLDRQSEQGRLPCRLHIILYSTLCCLICVRNCQNSKYDM